VCIAAKQLSSSSASCASRRKRRLIFDSGYSRRPSTRIVETVTVDVIEEPAPGVVTITEIEETAEVREEGPG
jgi:hypothetical protein